MNWGLGDSTHIVGSYSSQWFICRAGGKALRWRSPGLLCKVGCSLMAEASSESYDHFANIAGCPGGVLFARLAFVCDNMQI